MLIMKVYSFLIGENMNDSLHIGSGYSLMTKMLNNEYKIPLFQVMEKRR